MFANLVESLPADNPTDACDDEAIPSAILESRGLAEVHRFELALLVACKERSLKVATQLIRNAAAGESLYFAARQTFDDARHLEALCRRRDAALASARDAADLGPDAVLGRPLSDYFTRCLALAEEGAQLEALTLLNLVFKSMAIPLHALCARYWQSVDPVLSMWLTVMAEEEEVHVRRAAQLVRGGGAGDESRQVDLRERSAEAAAALSAAFRFQIGSFVSRFGAAARRHRVHFADAEFTHGRPLLRVPQDEQIAFIHARCIEALVGTLAQAGLQGRRR